ncbi:MAG: hypothetical protein ACKPKO_11735, partial [Candidatus Fonsibacter sp.]
MQNYNFSDYDLLLSHFFSNLCVNSKRLAGIMVRARYSTQLWALPTLYPTVNGEESRFATRSLLGHSTTWRKTIVWKPANLTYVVEVWNPSFNAELNEPNRCSKLARWRATHAVADFTPQTAIGFFPQGTALGDCARDASGHSLDCREYLTTEHPNLDRDGSDWSRIKYIPGHDDASYLLSNGV